MDAKNRRDLFLKQAWDAMCNENIGVIRTSIFENLHVEPLTLECSHSKKYLNKITTSMQFWVCPDCNKDLGNA